MSARLSSTHSSQQLLRRLDRIAERLAARPGALALLALGSTGTELERLDDFSDLDFFVLVQPGFKAAFRDNLDWLAEAAPIAYAFRNTPDGYKLMFADGVFAEYAVFEPPELRSVPFAAGRLVWHAPEFDPGLATPTQTNLPPAHSVEWLVGEALTNLLVGLARFRRGEKLSAMRFIQVFAVDRLVELSVHLAPAASTQADLFSAERRYERRYPGLATHLPAFLPGYEHSPAAARAILAFLAAHFDVNPAIRQAILELAEGVE
jgi:hypothetical protein